MCSSYLSWSEVIPCLRVFVCLCWRLVVVCVSQHSDVSVLEFHLERTPLLTSPHPPELTGQSVPPLDFTSSVLSVCYTPTPDPSLVCMFVFVSPPRSLSEGRIADSAEEGFLFVLKASSSDLFTLIPVTLPLTIDFLIFYVISS